MQSVAYAGADTGDGTVEYTVQPKTKVSMTS